MGGIRVKQAKGSIIKLVVKIIKANKSGIYKNMFSNKAKELLSQRILDSIWYPFEGYKELYNAVCQVEGKNDLKVMLQWGRSRGEELMTSIYKSSLVERDLKSAIENYKRFHRGLFNFGEIVVEHISDNEIVVTYKNFDLDWENFYYNAIGWMQRFLELCIGKNLTYKILQKSWEGADATRFSLSWT